MFTKKILAAAITSQPSANGVADAIDFDGATDYLSRTSDLVGNADGKTFTFSAWVYFRSGLAQRSFITLANGGFDISQAGYSIQVICRDSGGSIILNTSVVSDGIPTNSWFNLLISVDLTNATNRHIYINDVVATGNWTAYSNGTIDFTGSTPKIADGYYGKYNGRLAHVYLDKTYRDLSVEANRRIFITADRKPAANQAALNPILYLPLNDPTQPGKNLGTGGDFTLNGVVARSGRGPSQFNTPYSDLDGVADFLSRTTAPTGLTNDTQFTVSFSVQPDIVSGIYQVVTFSDASNIRLEIAINARQLSIWGRSAATTVLLGATTSAVLVTDRNALIQVSVDLTSTSKRHVIVNGQSAAVTWSTYTNTNIEFAPASPFYRIGCGGTNTPSGYFNGRLGNVFFDTKYIDLSVPANLAKFVTGTGIDAKPADLGANGEKPFGTAPLIYLPMYGNNAGKNYGTGGDFTVNSGPFPGARGPNEFWGNKAGLNGVTAYLSRTAQLSGIVDGKTASLNFHVNVSGTLGMNILSLTTASMGSIRFAIGLEGTTNKLKINGYNASNVQILGFTSTSGLSASTQYSVQAAFDLANSSNRSVYVNGTAFAGTWGTYTNDSVDFTVAEAYLGQAMGFGGTAGQVSEFYFTTDYIDFSQEANRLKFRDAFGNPVDLAPQIAAGALPNPAIYMRFDPANFGKNSGTGGDFVVNGTITDGGQL